jgi:hypothetical protein
MNNQSCFCSHIAVAVIAGKRYWLCRANTFASAVSPGSAWQASCIPPARHFTGSISCIVAGLFVFLRKVLLLRSMQKKYRGRKVTGRHKKGQAIHLAEMFPISA